MLIWQGMRGAGGFSKTQPVLVDRRTLFFCILTKIKIFCSTFWSIKVLNNYKYSSKVQLRLLHMYLKSVLSFIADCRWKSSAKIIFPSVIFASNLKIRSVDFHSWSLTGTFLSSVVTLILISC